jgi:hypothetical protein
MRPNFQQKQIMRVAICSRVSTEEQKSTGYSLQGQEHNLLAFCKEMGGRAVALNGAGNIVGVAGSSGFEVYELNNNTWVPLGYRGPVGGYIDISSDGYTIVVGMNSRTHPYHSSPSGLASVYSYNGATWELLKQGVYGDNGDYLGAVSISADGTRVIAGGSNADAFGENSGIVRIFE